MTPTAKLRFVERNTGDWVFDRMHGSEACYKQKVLKVLQQWWEPEQNIIDMVAGKTQGEWRDVPLEQEQA